MVCTIIQGASYFFINFMKWDTELLFHWWPEASFTLIWILWGSFLSRELLPNLTGDMLAWRAWLWLSGLANTRILTRFLDEALRGTTTGSVVSWEMVGCFRLVLHNPTWYPAIFLSQLWPICLCSLLDTQGDLSIQFSWLDLFPIFRTRIQTIPSESVA